MNKLNPQHARKTAAALACLAWGMTAHVQVPLAGYPKQAITDATWGMENRTTALRLIPGSDKSQRETVGIPHTLADIGIDDVQAGRVGRMASEDPSGGTNPVAYTPDQYAELFRAAVRGIL